MLSATLSPLFLPNLIYYNVTKEILEIQDENASTPYNQLNRNLLNPLIDLLLYLVLIFIPMVISILILVITRRFKDLNLLISEIKKS